MYLAAIESALRSGCKLHAFLSGGGLRVVRIERDGKLVGYGEHTGIHDALSHAAEDFHAGGRPYDEVYGGSKPLYLTGSSSPSDALDAWILQGHTMDAYTRNGAVVVVLNGHEHQRVPENVMNRCLKGEAVQWSARGFTFKSRPAKFPNGEACVSIDVVECRKGADQALAWIYPVRAEAGAPTLQEALDVVLSSPPVEA